MSSKSHTLQILFVTWDGPTSKYLEGLFLPILAGLSSPKKQFHVLHFTSGSSAHRDRNRSACKRLDISYQSVRILKFPKSLGALISAFIGAFVLRRVVKKRGINVLFPRSTMPALVTLLARISSIGILFDADGLPIDERVDFAGKNSSSLILRFLRDAEAEIVRRSDQVLVRAQSAVSILVARAGAGISESKFHVVGNGRDPSIFRPTTDARRNQFRQAIGLDASSPLIIYVGSMGSKYLLPEMIKLFELIHRRRSDSHFLLITNDPESTLLTIRSESRLSDNISVISATPEEVPAYLECGDVGLALIEPSYSMRAVAPIKWGEYLLTGVPVITTLGVGDEFLISEECGRATLAHDDDSLREASDWFVDVVLKDRSGFRNRCRACGVKHFSLEETLKAYGASLDALSILGGNGD